MAVLDTDNAQREIVMERVLNGPRDLVWRAWTELEHVSKWWGPDGFTTTTKEMDVRVGGMWRFIMHGPDGTDYPNRMTFREVTRPERLVYEHGSDVDNDPNSFTVTTEFTAIGDKTKVSSRLLFRTREACEATKQYNAVELGKQSLAKLDAYVQAM